MAKAIATCTCERCGATFEKQTFKRNRREADSWAEWAEQTFTLCPDCEQREREDKAAELAKKAKEGGMATLSGTPKQLVWAEQVRDQLIREMDNEWNMLRERLDRVEKADGADSDSANALRNDIKIYDATRTYILCNISSASWWIDQRSESAGYMIIQVYKNHKNEIDMQFGSEPHEETGEVLTPDNPAHGTADIKIVGQRVRAIYPKDETFRRIVKDMGFKFDSSMSRWSLSCNQFTGDAADRAAELANTLLRSGFSVTLDDPDVREMAVNATFTPRVTRWIARLTTGKYAGWLKISLPKNFGAERDHLYNEARKLRGSEYYDGGVVVPVSSHELVEDFARVNGYKLSNGALEAISSYEDARMRVKPAEPVKQTQPDVLGDILKSDSAVLPDLVDDDAVDH